MSRSVLKIECCVRNPFYHPYIVMAREDRPNNPPSNGFLVIQMTNLPNPKFLFLKGVVESRLPSGFSSITFVTQKP